MNKNIRLVEIDFEILCLIHQMRIVATRHIHNSFYKGQSKQNTNDKLKRLTDHGYLLIRERKKQTKDNNHYKLSSKGLDTVNGYYQTKYLYSQIQWNKLSHRDLINDVYISLENQYLAELKLSIEPHLNFGDFKIVPDILAIRTVRKGKKDERAINIFVEVDYRHQFNDELKNKVKKYNQLLLSTSNKTKQNSIMLFLTGQNKIYSYLKKQIEKAKNQFVFLSYLPEMAEDYPKLEIENILSQDIFYNISGDKIRIFK